MKKYLDDLVKKYETVDFIKDDPVQFPHRFHQKQDIEISALIASSFAFGRREKIIQIVEKIHQIMQNEPYNFCLDYKKNDGKIFDKGLSEHLLTGEKLSQVFQIDLKLVSGANGRLWSICS